MKGRDIERKESFVLNRLNMSYAYAVYKTADISTTLQMSNRAIAGTSRTDGTELVQHPEQMGYCGTSRTGGLKRVTNALAFLLF
ncbi:MAG: hypothetical protein IPN26_01935 [Bacteroidetes bacterium]|nr:hypothetical protein [Bacteroidota bacterium]